MMSTVQVPSAVVVLGAMVPALAACGSSGGVTFSDVQGCLQNAGYGVSVVPTAELVSGGAENRGPGQTGELWVGLSGSRPPSAGQAAAIVAFWDSAAHAKSSPNAQDSNVTSHADAIGSVTVQAGGPLFATAIARNRAATPSGVVSAVKSSLTKIENCAR